MQGDRGYAAKGIDPVPEKQDILRLPPPAVAANPAHVGISPTEYGYERKTGVRAILLTLHPLPQLGAGEPLPE